MMRHQTGSTKRHSLLSTKHISKEFLAAASKFAEAPVAVAAEDNGQVENAAPEPANAGRPSSSRKSSSLRSMFPLLIPVSNPTKRDDAPPPLPKKLKLQEEEEEQAKRELEEKQEEKPVQTKKSRASISSSDGLNALRGVFRTAAKAASPAVRSQKLAEVNSIESETQPSSRLTRQASSSGSEYSGANLMATRLAKTDIKFVEMKNKLADTQGQLSAANARCDELEREVDRLNKENRDLRKRLEGILNANKQQQPQSAAASSSSSPEEVESHLVKVENLDKSITSRVLLQMAESFGGEVTTARIMRAPTGALNGYCSFANEKDAQKAVDMWKKMGLTSATVGASCASSVPNGDEASEASRSAKIKRWKN